MRAFILGALILAAATPARSDQLVFQNSDRLTGALVALSDGKLEFDSESLGTLSIDVEKLRSVSTDSAVEIHRADGSILIDALEEDQEGRVRTAGSSRSGVLKLVLADIVAINPPEPEVWSGTVRVGGTLERGNANTESANAELRALRRGEENRVSFLAGYRGRRQEDESTGEASSTARDLYAAIKYEHLLTQRFYAYISSRAEKDGVANLSLRLINGAGGGFQIWDTDDLQGSVEVGLAWVRENFSDRTRDDDYIAALLGWDFARRLADGVRVFQRGSWVPSLEDSRDHLVSTETGLRSEVASDLFLELKLRWTWDSTPAQEKDRQDVVYILGMGYDF